MPREGIIRLLYGTGQRSKLCLDVPWHDEVEGMANSQRPVADPSAPDDPPLLQMRGIVKQFPGVRALDEVDLEVAAGEVHCLLGQNGAGKSTLIKVLAGAHRPDSGRVEWVGQGVSLPHPQAAMEDGVATLYHALDPVEELSVGEDAVPGAH